jgi:molecular chaperone GrpE
MSGVTQVEAILERFRQRLDEFRADAVVVAPPATLQGSEAGSARQFGLIDLVEEFTALRQELKLQTKSTRGLQEQTEALLPPLRQAIEHIRSVAPREEQAAWTAGKPLAEGLATLGEALARCRAEIERAASTTKAELHRVLMQALDEHHLSKSWIDRRLSRRRHQQVRDLIAGATASVRQDWFESLLEGFELIQNRLRRVMQSEGIEHIECLDRHVDPERMIVVDLADAPDRPSHTVVEVLRQGYAWRGRILRLAEVRATGGRCTESRGEPLNGDGSEESEAFRDETIDEDEARPEWLETE